MLKHPLLFMALALAPGCGDEGPELPPLADFEVPPLRHVMFEVDELSRTIEPILRNETQTAQIGSMGRSLQRWIGDPAWGSYLTGPEFFGDPALFSEYLGWLAEGAEELSAAGEAGDLVGIRAGFTRMQQSCVACHKRFQPNI